MYLPNTGESPVRGKVLCSSHIMTIKRCTVQTAFWQTDRAIIHTEKGYSLVGSPLTPGTGQKVHLKLMDHQSLSRIR